MKKTVIFLLAVICMITLFSCGSDKKESNKNGETAENAKNTLMIYMVGSDLEAKGGSATEDLSEIAESGVDLSSANVVVYAGGSKKWHNDTVTADDMHSVLELGKDGFTTVETKENISMGDSECLLGFLNYAYENYPAENYSLILWNHGMGPLIGYGKDMFFDDDSLTLMDMKKALEASAFKDDNKLSWVGFDACLMSSAELATVWADHADYLIASQEIEPAFGWNYSFLKNYGKYSDTELIRTVTDEYFTACEEYFEKKGYDDRDTTLACIDLSFTDELSASINTLFKAVYNDVDLKYNELSASRVNTRALGRASTGSEYDLIDIYDMSEQLKDKYPEEVSSLQDVLGKMIIINSTNAENLCGMSIYYPFYNKSYYEKSWKDAYTELNAFPEYGSYLDKYSSIWLKGDLVESLAESVMPNVIAKDLYTLELTEEQAAAYTDSRYYILVREGEGLYRKVFSSHNISKDDNTLTANFDGNIIYGKDKFDNYFIPNLEEHDTVGDITRYSCYLNLSNNYSLYTAAPEDFEHKVEGHRFHLAVNTDTKEIKTSALVPYDAEMDIDSLSGGKIGDADLSQWTTYNFLHERHRYLERYGNGSVKPVDSWKVSDFISYNAVKTEDELEFVMAPLVSGEYYLIFEIDDSQGNSYCSELLAITSDGSLPVDYEQELITKEWKDGDSVEFFNDHNVTASLTTVDSYGDLKYSLSITNNNSFDITFLATDLSLNEAILCPDVQLVYTLVGAGETVTDSFGFDFGTISDLDVVQELKSMQFIIKISNKTGSQTIVYDQPVDIKLSADKAFIPRDTIVFAGYYDIVKPSYSAFAEEQLLFEHNGLKGTLLGAGGNDNYSTGFIMALKVENTADTTKHFTIDGFSMNDMFFDRGSGPMSVYPGMTVYKIFSYGEDDLAEHYLDSIEKLEMHIRFTQYATLEGGGGFSEAYDYPIVLKETGTASAFPETSEIIFSKNGVTMSLVKLETPADNSFDQFEWYCIISNTGNEDVSIDITDVTLNGQAVDVDQISGLIYLSGGKCKAGGYSIGNIRCSADAEAAEISFKVYATDFNNEKILWEDETVYKVKA